VNNYIGFLQINLVGELFADLVQCSSAPVTEPVQHTSTAEHHQRMTAEYYYCQAPQGHFSSWKLIRGQYVDNYSIYHPQS